MSQIKLLIESLLRGMPSQILNQKYFSSSHVIAGSGGEVIQRYLISFSFLPCYSMLPLVKSSSLNKTFQRCKDICITHNSVWALRLGNHICACTPACFQARIRLPQNLYFIFGPVCALDPPISVWRSSQDQICHYPPVHFLSDNRVTQGCTVLRASTFLVTT